MLSIKKRIFESQFIKMSKENQSNLLVTFSNIISNVLNPLFSLLIFLWCILTKKVMEKLI
jgi:hypothetical protein